MVDINLDLEVGSRRSCGRNLIAERAVLQSHRQREVGKTEADDAAPVVFDGGGKPRICSRVRSRREEVLSLRRRWLMSVASGLVIDGVEPPQSLRSSAMAVAPSCWLGGDVVEAAVKTGLTASERVGRHREITDRRLDAARLVRDGSGVEDLWPSA